MHFKSLLVAATLGLVSASAYAVPLEGAAATVVGRAHVRQEADGTYIYFGGPGSFFQDAHAVAAVVPFDDKSTFPDIEQLDGRRVQITGVVNGQRVMTLTDPEQIHVIG